MSGGMFALPGPGWGGVTPYHKYMIHETSESYICSTSMPGNGRQEEEVARAAFKGTVNRLGGTSIEGACLARVELGWLMTVQGTNRTSLQSQSYMCMHVFTCCMHCLHCQLTPRHLS
jgi:hypothetical protein